jgi:hypothetical protein
VTSAPGGTKPTSIPCRLRLGFGSKPGLCSELQLAITGRKIQRLP